MIYKARAFTQDCPWGIAGQGCTSLLQQLWERGYSRPNCICFSAQGFLTPTQPLDCCCLATTPVMALFTNSSSHPSHFLSHRWQTQGPQA